MSFLSFLKNRIAEPRPAEKEDAMPMNRASTQPRGGGAAKPVSDKCYLSVWHMNDLPVINCGEDLKNDLEQIDYLTRSLARLLRSTGCERYLLPPLSMLSKRWQSDTMCLYKALHQLRDYGYQVVVPGCHGDITVSKIAKA